MEIEIKFNETFEAPMGSPRPRFSTKGRYAHTYMPTKYTEHKKIFTKSNAKAKSRKCIKNRIRLLLSIA